MFIEKILIDYSRNSIQSFVAILKYRIMSHRFCGFFVFRIIFFILFKILFVVLSINCRISNRASIGKGIKLIHGGDGVVISGTAVIEDNVTIYHHVTIGVNENKKGVKDLVIGESVVLAAGSKVISCKVGAFSIIGVNAVITRDIKPNSRVYSNSIVRELE